MASSQEYRKLAAEFQAKAASTESASSAAEWIQLAEWYTRLAAEADRNALTDIVYEAGPPLRLDRKDG